MIDWLTTIFGFTVRASYKDDAGVVQHAELAYGSSMIMLGTVADDAYGAMVGGDVTPGGKSTYVVGRRSRRAVRHGPRRPASRSLEGLTDRSYGSREFIVRDPEGNVWCFGTYWPKAGDAGLSGTGGAWRRTPRRPTTSRAPAAGGRDETRPG